MISLKHNFLFVHIPKTAGNSIQSILKAYSEDNIVCLAPYQDGIERFEVRSEHYNIHKHSSLQEYREQLGEKTFKKIFKFTSVRNPWDRLISYYFSPHRGKISWNRDKFIEFVQIVQPMSNYINLDGSNITDMSYFNSIDFFIRYENLNNDFKQVCEKIGILYEKLPHRNRTNRRKYVIYYDDELVELVRNKFYDEIRFFGYEFDNNA